ncbi:MAG: hypothetical protein NBV65_02105 [Burkholderiaceae bacterium]|nr:hypothetical protein [Burkholderiaceae bacterium]
MDTIFGMPMDEAEARYLRQQQPMQPRGIADYLPNVFGGNPAQIAGLLGEQQAGAISRQANVSGLLGAAIAIANGMSPQGPRRSAAQNILNALGTGLQTSQGVYQNAMINATRQAQAQAFQQRAAREMQAADIAAQESDFKEQDRQRRMAVIQKAERGEPLTQSDLMILDAGKVVDSTLASMRPQASVLNRDQAVQLGLPIDGGQVYQRKTDGTVDLVSGTTPKPQARLLSVEEQRQLGLPTNRRFQLGANGEVTQVAGTEPKAPAEPKPMYGKEPVFDKNGRAVFPPMQAGLPAYDATTGQAVPYEPVNKGSGKPPPASVIKAEDEDFEKGQSAIDLANEANDYLKKIGSGRIKFGLYNRLTTPVENFLGATGDDAAARNDFNRFRTRLVNESLRLNKGTQTEGDAERAAKELQSAESQKDAAAAIAKLRDLNARAAKNSSTNIVRRRKNNNLDDPEQTLTAPEFAPYITSDAEYDRLPPGAEFYDPNGNLRVKPGRK